MVKHNKTMQRTPYSGLRPLPPYVTVNESMGVKRVKRGVSSHITTKCCNVRTDPAIVIRGYIGLAAVDEKHQIIVEAQHVGCGEHGEPHQSRPMRFVPHRILHGLAPN